MNVETELKMASQNNSDEIYDCENPKFNPYDLVSFMAGPAVFVTAVFALFVKRKALYPDLLNGRPGIVYAVNLLDSYRDRIGHACAIGVSCVSILDLFFGNSYVDINYDDVPVMVRGATKTLVLTANVWMVTLVYFPISLCLTTKKKTLGNAVGFAYTAVWTSFYVHRLVECPRKEGRIGELTFLMVVPIFVLYFGLHVQFAMGLWKCWRDRNIVDEFHDAKGHVLSEMFVQTHYYERIRYLLTPKKVLENRVNPKPSDEKQLYKKLQRVIEKVYRSESGFKYSRRMVVTSVLAALSLYELGIAYIGGLGIFFEYVGEVFKEEGTFKDFFEFTNSTESFYEIEAFYIILRDSFWPTSVAAMGISIGFNIHFLYYYRQNTLNLWKGIKKFIPEDELPNSYIVASSLRYSGYHVGFALWGFLILQVLFWLITFVCWYFIVRPISLGESNFLTTLIRNQWLTAVVGLVIYYGQILASRIFFLEGNGKILSLTNRRSLHNSTYFFLFLNILLGLFSCLLRIGYSVLFGILLVGRIDRCLLMKGYELWDSGFKSYVAFMQLEVAQTHPVVVSFCYMMWKMTGKRSRLESIDGYDRLGESRSLRMIEGRRNNAESESCRKARVARNRWLVAYTLVQNPSLVIDRSPDAFRMLLRGGGETGDWEETRSSQESKRSSSSSMKKASISSIDETTFTSANQTQEENKTTFISANQTQEENKTTFISANQTQEENKTTFISAKQTQEENKTIFISANQTQEENKTIFISANQTQEENKTIFISANQIQEEDVSTEENEGFEGDEILNEVPEHSHEIVTMSLPGGSEVVEVAKV
ncbi:stimulated by retinoic acid gene 6 protein-like [Apostichopus japonicus]|uniref:stimulated by retinoic acid gene 6 protein-like n=1 Tax=Stichopus japonicus TaxID=307972 RepID=UPI003AB2AE2F